MKVALVTGGGSGIGRAVAHKFVEDGMTVMLAGRRRDKLEETRSGASDPERVVSLPCDVTDPDSVASAFSEIEQRFGRLDVVFNNAGVSTPGALPDEMLLDDWNRVINTNLNGVYLVARSAFALMRKQTPQGGRIINNGSISAQVPRPGAIAYAA